MTQTMGCVRSQVECVRCFLRHAATGQSSAFSQMFTPHYRQPQEETSTDIPTNKETEKKEVAQ